MSDYSLLLNALRLNAWFSGTSALVLLLAAPWVAAQLGLSGPVPVYAAAGLLVAYALQLAHIVRTGEIHAAEIIGIIAADLAWVLGTAVLVAMFYQALTIAGLVLVDIVAVAVLFLAVQQIRGLRALRN